MSDSMKSLCVIDGGGEAASAGSLPESCSVSFDVHRSGPDLDLAVHVHDVPARLYYALPDDDATGGDTCRRVGALGVTINYYLAHGDRCRG